MAGRSSLRRRAGYALGAGALAGMLLVLAWWVAIKTPLAHTGAPLDRGAAERYGQQLETLRLLDTELSAEVLKTRSGLILNYDGLVRIERLLNGLQQALRAMPEFLDVSQRALLNDELQACARASRQTFKLVERFKSESAVLRNSLLFLGTAASVLDGYPAGTPEERTFREGASALVRDLLLIRLFMDGDVLERVTRSLSRLTPYVDQARVERRAELRLVLAHAALVRDRAPQVDTLVRSIIHRPSTARALTLRYVGFYQAAHARTIRATALWLSLSLVVGAALALFVIWRMRRAASALRHTGQQLSIALESLRAEQDRQRELSDLKTRFVSMTSHEFRTPLSAIMSSSEMLCAYDERWTRDKKAQHFTRIHDAVLGMTRMLDAILLIGRSDAGKLEFKPGVVHVSRLCSEAAELASKALKPGHRLNVQGAADEELVVADEALMRHVVENLLSNAIKYSPAGGEIAFKVEREGSLLVLDVSDQGIGISASDRERLFEVFHRGSNVGSVSGSGLGLSIVKRAVDLHGGTVSVESELGIGSRFVVRLPCPRSAA